MVMYKGKQIQLSDGRTPKLIDVAHELAFTEFAEPIARCIMGKPEQRLSDSTRCWVRAPGWSIARDRDGAIIGLAQ